MNFEKFFHITEIAQKHVDKIANELQLKDLLKRRVLPFNQLFGDDLRQAEILSTGKQYEVDIQEIAPDYLYDFANWMGFKLTDKDKKNPTGIYKIFQKYKKQYEDIIQKNPHSVTYDQLVNIQARYTKLLEIMKKVDLRSQYNNAAAQNLVIIYSRAPIDVLRMSDHGWSSCHSPGNDYFHCALADAQENAGIAYLITPQDYEKIKDNLQAHEIFYDADRGLTGEQYIKPLSRVRIRALIDINGETLAIPSLRIYGIKDHKLNSGFQHQVLEWAKKQDISKFDWDNTLKLLGGTYEDANQDIAKYAMQMWNKDISYVNDDIENDFQEDDYDERYEQGYEQFLDQCRDEVDEDKILEYVVGDNGEYIPLEINYDKYDGTLEMIYNIPDYIMDKLKNNPLRVGIRTIDPLVNSEYSASVSIQNKELTFNNLSDYSISDAAEFYGPDEEGRFNAENFVKDIGRELQRCLEKFTDFLFGDDVGDLLALRMRINAMILDAFGADPMPESFPDESDIQYLADTLGKKGLDIAAFKIPNLPYKIIPKPMQYGHLNELYIAPEIVKTLEDTYDEIVDGIGGYTKRHYNLSDTVYSVFDMYMGINDSFVSRNLIKNGADRKYFIYSNDDKGKDYKNPTAILKMVLYDDILMEIIDAGEVQKYIEILDLYKSEEFETEVAKGATGLFEFWKEIKKYRFPLPDPRQMELDLSKLNRNMGTQFNKFIETVIEGLANMGQGGMAQRAKGATPQTTTPAATTQQNGTTGANTIQMKFANNNAATAQNNSEETNEFGQYHQLATSNPQKYNDTITKLAASDPQKFSRFLATLTPQQQGTNNAAATPATNNQPFN